MIKENCNITYYFNNTNIKPTVLDCGNEIVLANWPYDNHIECIINNGTSVRISSFPYVKLKRNVLCNCETKAENHFFWNHWQHVKNWNLC